MRESPPKTAEAEATAAAQAEGPILDERRVRLIVPVSQASLKRLRKHSDPLLRFPPPDIKFHEDGKNFWFESTVRDYLRRVAEHQREQTPLQELE